MIHDIPANTSMKLLLLHLVILTTFISHAKKPKRNQKNERASLLGLTDEYSTFELPFKYSPNLIKIGKIKTHRNTAAGCRLLVTAAKCSVNNSNITCFLIKP